MALFDRRWRWLARAIGAGALALAGVWPAQASAEYTGPLIDAHGHLPSAGAIDAYAAAAKRHGVKKVVLLGVGGVQKDDPAWIAAAARRYPDLVVPALPLPDPTDGGAAARMDAALATSGRSAAGRSSATRAARRSPRSSTSPPPAAPPW